MRTRFESLLREAESTPIDGWDFSRLGDRITTKPRPWNFEQILEEHAARSADLLDMGTGGGERIMALKHRPARTVATEAWPPNVDVAGRNLRPLGITVVWDEGAPNNNEQNPNEARGRLPFPSESFELISNRHESFLATEVARVLTKGGIFLTQQTGGNYDQFYDALALPRPERAVPEWDLASAITQITAAGLEIVESAESYEEVTFRDAGALAWYLRAVPWVVDDFSTSTHRENLEALQGRIENDGPLSVRQPSFWLKACAGGRDDDSLITSSMAATLGDAERAAPKRSESS